MSGAQRDEAWRDDNRKKQWRIIIYTCDAGSRIEMKLNGDVGL